MTKPRSGVHITQEQIVEILERFLIKKQNVSEIAEEMGINRNSVGRYVKLAQLGAEMVGKGLQSAGKAPADPNVKPDSYTNPDLAKTGANASATPAPASATPAPASAPSTIVTPSPHDGGQLSADPRAAMQEIIIERGTAVMHKVALNPKMIMVYDWFKADRAYEGDMGDFVNDLLDFWLEKCKLDIAVIRKP